MEKKVKFPKVMIFIGIVNCLIHFCYMGFIGIILLILGLFKIIPVYVSLIVFGLWLLVAIFDQIRMMKRFNELSENKMLGDIMFSILNGTNNMSMEELVKSMGVPMEEIIFSDDEEDSN